MRIFNPFPKEPYSIKDKIRLYSLSTMVNCNPKDKVYQKVGVKVKVEVEQNKVVGTLPAEEKIVDLLCLTEH